MASSTRPETRCGVDEGTLDIREQIFNDKLVGPAGMIQLRAASITSFHGIVYGFDPKLTHPGDTLFPFAEDPHRSFEGIEPVLAGHPLTRQAEARKTGPGIQVIPRFEPAVGLNYAADQHRWAAMVRVARYSLPADPNAPGGTALTREVGPVNSKSGAVVEVLRPGEPIAPEVFEAFVQGLLKAPFRTVETASASDRSRTARRSSGERVDRELKRRGL